MGEGCMHRYEFTRTQGAGRLSGVIRAGGQTKSRTRRSVSCKSSTGPTAVRRERSRRLNLHRILLNAPHLNYILTKPLDKALRHCEGRFLARSNLHISAAETASLLRLAARGELAVTQERDFATALDHLGNPVYSGASIRYNGGHWSIQWMCFVRRVAWCNHDGRLA